MLAKRLIRPHNHLALHQTAPKSEPVAMTSPVVMAMAGTESLPADATGKVKMSFVMPSKYTKATLPKPNDASVEIKEVSGCLIGLPSAPPVPFKLVLYLKTHAHHAHTLIMHPPPPGPRPDRRRSHL
jgi:hypothetical protein